MGGAAITFPPPGAVGSAVARGMAIKHAIAAIEMREQVDLFMGLSVWAWPGGCYHRVKVATREWLFKVDGDTLTISMGPGSSRPKNLESPKGAENLVFTLKRVKAKK